MKRKESKGSIHDKQSVKENRFGFIRNIKKSSACGNSDD